MVEFFIMRSLDTGVRLVETNTVRITNTIHITGHSSSRYTIGLSIVAVTDEKNI